jgi:ribosome-binding protein aMBF1 (putative translation factor)
MIGHVLPSWVNNLKTGESPEKVKTNVLCVSSWRAGILAWMQQRKILLSQAFAQVVRKHREARGLSRAVLAESAGLHQTYIGLLEREQRSPSLDTAASIANALEVPLADLIAEAQRLVDARRA